MNRETLTPMMQHYLSLKDQNPDAILMYRLGDFYEMFFDDAVTCSRELDLVLTGRAAGEQKAPMCGVPHHAVNSYISRLVKKGYKVAICEQLEDPKEAKGLVERGIVKIVTPGTMMDANDNGKAQNWLAAIDADGWKSCLILCDLSTGELRYDIQEKSLTNMMRTLSSLNVQEVVVSRGMDKSWQKAFSSSDSWAFSQQKKTGLEAKDEQLLPYQDPLLRSGLDVLMGYLQKTQMTHADHLNKMVPLYPNDAMILDPETKSHLELTTVNSTSSKAKSLWEFMDGCSCAMGSRLLKSWIESPLLDEGEILQRQKGIQDLLDQFLVRQQLRDHLAYVYDMERLAARISYQSASPRDILQLVSSLEHARPILELAAALTSFPSIQNVDPCTDLYDHLKGALVEDPPLTLKDGNVIAPGFNKELDEIRHLADESSDALLELESREKEKTGIKNLKVGYNRVFGYYIEVRKTQVSQIPEDAGYIQKQTLANANRYFTMELKELEEKILDAQDRKVSMEQDIFASLIASIKARLTDLQQLSRALALVDVLCTLADLANKNGYVCPRFSHDGSIEIVEGRHPVLEQNLSGFVSNHWKMAPDCCIELVTGPNMGGKSTWLRQNALIVIMAQAGSFIPARKAVLPVFDRIFTRIGASDDLMQGKSTFMMEMMEANNALKYATDRSLILFDEIGRGTATFDGMALAQAMLEYIDSAVHAKTLFSTHYHELTELEKTHPSIVNVHVDVRETKKNIEFRYRVIEGKADKSYGINVARLAGIPRTVLERAEFLLDVLESQNPKKEIQPSLFVMSPDETKKTKLIDSLKNLDVDNLSAREALSCLYELKEQAEKIES